jgi:phenylpyruvate tautomerase PptA (4-oxalocrotonate tautomerase family)
MKSLKTPITTVAALTTKILTKQHLIRDFTKIIMLAEGKAYFSDDANRVWVHIVELQCEDWGIGGHTDWLRDYESALNVLGTDLKPK